MIHSNAASPRRTPHGLTLALLLLLTAGCQDNSDPGGGGSRLIEVVGPSQFAGTPLDTVSALLAVRITDAGQHPLAGIPVTWATDDGALIPGAGETDAAGVARAAWVLGWRPGTQQARATAAGSDGTALFQAAAEGFRAEHLSTGDGRHQCGIDQSGALFCWGTNEEGQLGNGTTTGSDTPVRAQVDLPVAQVVTGAANFTCALTGGGEVYCWGSNGVGQLGNGSMASSLSPVRVLLPAVPFRSLSAEGRGICAVAVQGDGYCWGENLYGRFGIGTPEAPEPTPALILGGYAWRQVVLADDRACGVREGGAVYCWGRELIPLGIGVDTATLAPRPVINAPPMDSLALSGWHQCGITAANQTYCWGSNRNIGVDDPREDILDPLALAPTPVFRAIYSLFKPTFALGTDNRGYWWGPPPGATGGGPLTPELFSGEIPLRALGTSDSGVCGIEETTGTVYCWSEFGWEGSERLVAVPVPIGP